MHYRNYRDYAYTPHVHCTSRPIEIRDSTTGNLSINILNVGLEDWSCWSCSAGLILEQRTVNIKLNGQLQFCVIHTMSYAHRAHAVLF